MQHTRGGHGAAGAVRVEEVLVMREGTSHVSAFPPEALELAES
jgi:hypothetical protein